MITIGIGTPRFYNVYVNGVSLRGYTHDEGVALFDTIEEEWQNKSYELYYGDDSWTFSPATVSAQLNVDTVLERAWNYGRVGSLSYRKSQIKSLNSNPYYFESDITYDESQLEAFIAGIHEAVDTCLLYTSVHAHLRVRVGIFVIADTGDAQAGKAMRQIAEGRVGIGGFVQIRSARTMHHDHRRERALALGERQKAVRGIILSGAQNDRFFDIAVRVRFVTGIARCHRRQAQRRETPLCVKGQRKQGIRVCKRALDADEAVTALLPCFHNLRILQRAQHICELCPCLLYTSRCV